MPAPPAKVAVAMDTLTWGQMEGLQIVDVDRLDCLHRRFRSNVRHRRGVAVSNGYACVADMDAGLVVIDVDRQDQLRCRLCNHAGIYSGVAARVVTYTWRRDIGLQIVDVETPGSPSIVNSINTRALLLQWLF